MADLIDRTALANRMQFLIRTHQRDAFDALNEIDNAPAVDAVEVTRCKDCKWYKDFGTNYRLMDCSHEEGLEWANENDFCSRGERREDDERN